MKALFRALYLTDKNRLVSVPLLLLKRFQLCMGEDMVMTSGLRAWTSVMCRSASLFKLNHFCICDLKTLPLNFRGVQSYAVRFGVLTDGVGVFERLPPAVSTCLSLDTYLLTYLLTYFLHGAGSFLRS